MVNNVPISELENYSEVLRRCDDGATVYLTQNGHAKYVINNIDEYNKLLATTKLLAKLCKGVEDVRAGRVHSVEDAFEGLVD